MGIFSAIFGGGTDKASEQSLANQRADNAARLSFIKQQAGQARSDVKDLFPKAQEARDKAYDNAFSMIAGAFPQQLSMFQQGNIGAQNQINRTLPQVQNALLGLPMDYSAFQPQQITPDLSFLDPWLPQSPDTPPAGSGGAGSSGGSSSGSYGTGGTTLSQIANVPVNPNVPIIELQDGDPRPKRRQLLDAGLGNINIMDMMGQDLPLAHYRYEGGPIRGGGYIAGGQLSDGQMEAISRGERVWNL